MKQFRRKYKFSESFNYWILNFFPGSGSGLLKTGSADTDPDPVKKDPHHFTNIWKKSRCFLGVFSQVLGVSLRRKNYLGTYQSADFCGERVNPPFSEDVTTKVFFF